MIITNKYGLPQALVDFVTKRDEDYVRDPLAYGVTTLLKGAREVILKRRHDGEIVQDISDMLWMIFGSAVHKIAEESDRTGNAERDVKIMFENGYGVRGRVDYYNAQLNAIEDYKTCSVWKVIYSDFEDWYYQGVAYAILWGGEKPVKRVRFHALLKDWKVGDYRVAQAKGSFYPEHAMWTWEHEITEEDIAKVYLWMKKRLWALVDAMDLLDDALPLCTPSERWNEGDKYAVMKNGRKTALRVLDSEEDANKYLKEEGGDYIEVRKGVDRKCQDYCLVKDFCTHYQSIKGELK